MSKGPSRYDVGATQERITVLLAGTNHSVLPKHIRVSILNSICQLFVALGQQERNVLLDELEKLDTRLNMRGI